IRLKKAARIRKANVQLNKDIVIILFFKNLIGTSPGFQTLARPRHKIRKHRPKNLLRLLIIYTLEALCKRC
ncbi:TPA: hypothetical protein ACFJUO_001672, partial [Neisseria gonorrhoeae]